MDDAIASDCDDEAENLDEGGTLDDNYHESDSSSNSEGEDEGNQYSNGDTDIDNSEAGTTVLYAT